MGAVFSSCYERKKALKSVMWDSDDDGDVDYANVQTVVVQNKDGSYSILSGGMQTVDGIPHY